MSELSDEASESELLNHSLSMWHGVDQFISHEELDVPLDLYTASSIGQYDVVKNCIQSGSLDLNKKNLGGWTPLMYASYIGHDTIVHLLLEAGVDVNITTKDGLTPLILAASCGNESIAYFLLQKGAELEMKDNQGWTALFHCTSNGHQQMVKLLLDNGANANLKEPIRGLTPLMEAAASGHEIIVQYFLTHGVSVNDKEHTGATARTLAMRYGYMKIVSLIDQHTSSASKPPCRGPGQLEDLSSSDESYPTPRRRRPTRKGPSIHDGPQALAEITGIGEAGNQLKPVFKKPPPGPPQGYVTFLGNDGLEDEDIRNRDVTSPINEQDVESNSSRDEPAFFNPMETIRSSSSSSEGLAKPLGISNEGSLESNEDSDQAKRSSSKKQTKCHKGKSRHANNNGSRLHILENSGIHGQSNLVSKSEVPKYTGPKDLTEFLEQIGCTKYLPVLEEQDVDLRIFLTLTESDLKEVGITLFGPKRKMTSAIARWHSNTRPPSDALEQAYADQLEAEMQEMAIQLHNRCEEVEVLKGQVSQERELRTVMEGFMMEGIKWTQFQKQVEETQSVTKDLGVLLQQMKACQMELASRVKNESAGSKGHETKKKQGTEVAGLDGWTSALKSYSLADLVVTLQECTGDMGTALTIVNQNLEKLKDTEKEKRDWAEP
uniref:Ankyrin repeat and sterile alpha motif domain containing 3 n=1 Tax=Latimeria chalumnae TaxID=7897 RepID=H2ZWM3_LATCH